MNRLQLFILMALGTAALVILAGAGLVIVETINHKPLATLPVATVPPNPILLTRAPLCQDVLRMALAEQGWQSSVVLDAQQAILTVDVATAVETPDLPADRIWGAFEAALAGRAGGCAGYGVVVVQVGRYRAEAGVDDLLAWGTGELDDGAFSERVVLSQ